MSRQLTPPIWYDKNGNLIEILTGENGDGCVSVGNESKATSGAVAIGHSAKSTGGSTIVGTDSNSLYNECVIVGAGASSGAQNSVIIGTGASGICENGIVIGYGSSIIGKSLIAIGPNISMGTMTVQKENAIQIGDPTISYTAQIGDGTGILNCKINVDSIYPVGSIYMSVNSTNPTNYFGGTWVAWGTGRVPVGVDANDADFSTTEKTGGEKNHTLIISEMPSHTHEYVVKTGSSAGVASGVVAASAQGDEVTRTVLPNGSGEAHNNLQPYITCYMWKRTA